MKRALLATLGVVCFVMAALIMGALYSCDVTPLPAKADSTVTIGCQFWDGSQPTLTLPGTTLVQCDQNGKLIISNPGGGGGGSIGTAAVPNVSQLISGPSGNTATVTAANALKVDNSAVTQPVSGAISFTAPQHAIIDSGGGTPPFTGAADAQTAAATQSIGHEVFNGTTWDRLREGSVLGSALVTVGAALPAGSNTIGNVGIAAGAAAIGTVSLNAAVPAGTNVIGHTINDSGSTTAVTGTVAVSGAAPLDGTIDTAAAAANQGVGMFGWNSTNAAYERLRVSAQGTTIAAGVKGVLGVQGTTGGVPLPVNGTVTANAGTGNFTVTQATGSNLHIQCDSGCGAPAAATYTNISSSGNTVIKASAGTFYGVQALSATAQTVTLICYDNATTNSGNQFINIILGSSQTVNPVVGVGIAATAGITCNLSGAATGTIGIYWK
ncbi:MAG: hypothetical protein ACR2KS_10225 [Candidatus Eremiobacter antarcticus]|nr:hypothetical protein [Candidatus Eremiobacteraeota bacterium]MBC5808809.1 hypothetical protein [Candidatus Eremiobacteraeota bacterium]